MSEIALVTANFNQIDDLKGLPPHAGIDAFYFTDEAGRARATEAAVASWTHVVVPDYPRSDFSSRLRSRYFKHQIHRLDEVRRYRWLVWADSALKFHDTWFIVEQAARLGCLPPRKRVLLVPHPERKTIREEYDYIRTHIDRGSEYLRIRYANEKMDEQMAYFERRGWDTEARLWCGGFWIVENSELFNRCWDDWWDQNLRFGLMDQLSLQVVLDEHGCEPQALEVSIWQNAHFTHVPHQRNV